MLHALRCYIEPIQKRVTLAQIERLASQLEQPLANAIMAALVEQRESISLQAIYDALVAGHVGRVVEMLSLDRFNVSMDRVQNALQNAVYTVGAATARELPVLRNVVFRFDQLNPKLTEWQRNYSLGLIREIDRGTREGIKTAITEGVSTGAGPLDTARNVRQVIGLTNRQAKAVANYRRELENWHLKRSINAFGIGQKIDRIHGMQVFKPSADGTPKDGVDQRRLRDFRFDGQLSRAFKTGKPLTAKQIDKMVDAYARKYLKHRSQTIARTEAIRTANVGIQESWRQAVNDGKVDGSLVRREWIVAADERLCEHCAPIPGLNPKGVRLDQPFDTPLGSVMLPPLHPNCRCTTFISVKEPGQKP